MNHNRIFHAFIGSCVGIVAAWTYVEAGGPLGVMFYGRVLHHVDYGFALLVLAIMIVLGVRAMGIRIPWKPISGLLGFSIALITDEVNIFLNFGRRYTILLYNSPVNVIANLVLVVSLLVAARMPFQFGLDHMIFKRYLKSLLNDL
ncbi:MAG: hypothetical protein AAE987_06470 [Thermoplasmataceae archaeon]